MFFQGNEKYNCATYLRLSRSDGDQHESNSIKNQRALLNDYMGKHPELHKFDEYVDDGYSGTNFERPDFKRMMEALKGRDCYGGLDLSSTGDITAFVLMFPPKVPEEKYIMLPFFWIPEDTIPQRVRRASVPYDVWYQQGYLMATEGNVIHYGFIEKIIEELGKTYHILEIAFDRWGAVQMTQNLEGMGFTVVPFGQGFKDMSPPTKEYYKLLMEGRIIHGGNPVMAWMAGNVVVDTDPAGNIKPTKAKSPEKIDGIVAAIMALDRCIRNEGQQQGSVYDERDMIVF